jgi:hypothetical protein
MMKQVFAVSKLAVTQQSVCVRRRSRTSSTYMKLPHKRLPLLQQRKQKRKQHWWRQQLLWQRQKQQLLRQKQQYQNQQRKRGEKGRSNRTLQRHVR